MNSRDIDLWVISELFSKVHAGALAGKTAKFSFNVSAPSLQDQHFSDTHCQLLEKYELKPTQFVIELTETAYIHNESFARDRYTSKNG